MRGYFNNRPVNIKKSNHLPELNPEIEGRIHNHLKLCIESGDPIVKNDLQYFYQVIQKQKEFTLDDKGKIVAEIIEFIKQELNNLIEIIPGELYHFES